MRSAATALIRSSARIMRTPKPGFEQAVKGPMRTLQNLHGQARKDFAGQIDFIHHNGLA